jgi:hypothetical protein
LPITKQAIALVLHLCGRLSTGEHLASETGLQCVFPPNWKVHNWTAELAGKAHKQWPKQMCFTILHQLFRLPDPYTKLATRLMLSRFSVA